MNAGVTAPLLWCWRHPRAIGAEGRCIGHTDLAVDPRKARRLAHRIRDTACRHGLPREVWVSPLMRSREVGRVLRRWGFVVHVDARLMELNFGPWDGQPWSAIAWSEVEAWQADLLHHVPGGGGHGSQDGQRDQGSQGSQRGRVGQGESLAQLAARVQAFVQAFVQETEAVAAPRLLVTHGGWLNALGLLSRLSPRLLQPLVASAATDWPAPPRHGDLRTWPNSV